MEHFIKILGILAILGFIYVAMAIYRRLVKDNSNVVWRRLIPMWAVLIGMGLGLIFFECIPSIMPTTNILTSIIVGGIAGWAAVGANQFARLTFGEDGKRNIYIKTEQIVIKEDKPAEDSKPAAGAEDGQTNGD